MTENDLPDGIEAQDEVAVFWEVRPESTTLTITLGEAKIVMSSTDEESADALDVLVTSLPTIIEQAMEAIERQAADEAVEEEA